MIMFLHYLVIIYLFICLFIYLSHYAHRAHGSQKPKHKY